MPKLVADKQDWIQLGYELFTDQGKHGVIVEKMANKLQCNRSSFYWHFKTKKAFIREVVNHWVALETKNIISLINKKNTPQEQFDTLVILSFKKNPNLDFVFYLKKYAFEDAEVRDAIYGIDCLRKEYLATILKDLGMTESEAKVKTSLLYKYLIGYHETIRYKKQNKDYVNDVMKEIKYFINKKTLKK